VLGKVKKKIEYKLQVEIPVLWIEYPSEGPRQIFSFLLMPRGCGWIYIHPEPDILLSLDAREGVARYKSTPSQIFWLGACARERSSMEIWLLACLPCLGRERRVEPRDPSCMHDV